MSGTGEESKEPHKALPLDLARSQITTVRTHDGKSSLIMSGQALRGMRVLTPNTTNQTIITTNIVPHTVFKHDPTRTQLGSILSTSQAQSTGSITIQRPAQITLATAPVQSVPPGTSYHVPRGPAVVANLAAPRGNAPPGRPSLVVAQAQPAHFARPPRTPSPAPGAAWLSTSNGAPIKGAATVLSSPVRGASVTGKSQLVARAQGFAAIRPGSAILHSAITIGPGFKGGGVGVGAGPRAQVVYSPGAPRMAVGAGVRAATPARLAIPVSVTTGAAGARLVAPQAVLAAGARIATVAQGTGLRGRAPVVVGPARTLSLVVAGAAKGGQVGTKGGQPGAIHFTPIPVANKTSSTVVTAGSNRTINVPTPIVTQRPSVVTTQAIPIAYSQGEGQQPGTTNVFIHTPIAGVPTAVSRMRSPSPTNAPQTNTSTITSNVANYSIGGGTYYLEPTSGNYTTSARPFTTSSQQSTSFAGLTQSAPSNRPAQVHAGLIPNQQMRFNPMMVVEPNRSQLSQSGEMSDQSQANSAKLTSSPRPTILRKRDHEGSPVKAVKNLTPILTNFGVQQPNPSISPPSRPDSRGNGHSSGGSTTISATSSPGLAEMNDDSNPPVPMNKDDETDLKSKPPMEMSPRKKPRKQQLTGNDHSEHHEDMQFITESKHHEEDSEGNQTDEPRDGAPEAGQVTTVRKPASASMLNGYQHNWKATHNHYLRHSDVRPKDERRPSIMDLSNQYRVQDKVNGWKIHHLSTQMEDLAEQEQTVYHQLEELLRNTERQESISLDKDLNRINELIKGNLQRVKIIKDGMVDAKSQIMKVFDHKIHVTDIINRCASKRNFKKRDKS